MIIKWSVYDKEMIVLLDKLFFKIEDGSAKLSMPDTGGERYDVLKCDQLINMLDKLINHEVVTYPIHWSAVGLETRGVKIDLPPDFNRLEVLIREAFTQEVYALKEKYKDVEPPPYNYFDYNDFDYMMGLG